MSATDKANTAGLEVVAWEARLRPDGDWYVITGRYVEARQKDNAFDVRPLHVTAASAEARIAELEAALAAAQTADAENDAHLRSRAQAAEARADRLGDSNGGLTLLPTLAELMNERD